MSSPSVGGRLRAALQTYISLAAIALSCTPVAVGQTVFFSAIRLSMTPVMDDGGDGVVDAGDVVNLTFEVSGGHTYPILYLRFTSTPDFTFDGCGSFSLSPFTSGTSGTCTGRSFVFQGQIDRGGWGRLVSLVGGSFPGNSEGHASAYGWLEIERRPGLAVEAAGTLDLGTAVPASVGDPVSYSFVVRNTGNVTLTNATLADPQVSSIACTGGLPIATLAPGGTVACTGSGQLTPGDVGAGTKVTTATASATAPDDSTVNGAGQATVQLPSFGPCPTASPSVDPVTLGSPISGSLAGTDVVSWDVTYNGVTTNFPGTDTTFVTPNHATAAATSVTIVARGFDANANPCSDTETLDLAFVAPTCGTQTQDPAGEVDVGAVLTLMLQTQGAIGATIDGAAMSAASGTPGIDAGVEWTASHVAVQDRTLTAQITAPDGQSRTCTGWSVDVPCANPTLVDVARVGQRGITLAGSADCTSTVRIVPEGTRGSEVFDVFHDENGRGFLDVVVRPGTIEIGQQGLPWVTDSFTVLAVVTEIPTLGSWGMGAFLLLISVLGVRHIGRG